jgi:hypothetical protein
MNIKKFIIIACVVQILVACTNSGEPEEALSILGIKFRIVDTNNDPVSGTGLHFALSFSDVMPLKGKIPGHDVLIDPSLLQNYPNPYNPQTSIRMTIPEQMPVKLSIHDLKTDSVINTLINADLHAGNYTVAWLSQNDSGDYVTNNIYRYVLSAGGNTFTRELCLNMADPEHIRSLNCIPIKRSDSSGIIDITHDALPLGKPVMKTDANGNELGIMYVRSDIDFIFIHNGYMNSIKRMTIDTIQAYDITITLQEF